MRKDMVATYREGDEGNEVDEDSRRVISGFGSCFEYFIPLPEVIPISG